MSLNYSLWQQTAAFHNVAESLRSAGTQLLLELVNSPLSPALERSTSAHSSQAVVIGKKNHVQVSEMCTYQII